MHAIWEDLRKSLIKSIHRLKAQQQFTRAKATQPALCGFDDPISLLTFLNQREGDLDQKDRIYAALIEVARSHTEEAVVASSLLWLGLWPGLDAIFRHRIRLYCQQLDALVSEIGGQFTALIHTIDLSRVTRVAATLIRNTDRQIGRTWQHHYRERQSQVEMPLDEAELSLATSLSGNTPTVEDPFEIADLHSRLQAIIGDDAALILLVTLQEINLQEAAQDLGLSYACARKRYARALQQLQNFFYSVKNNCPNRPSKMAFIH